MGKEHEVIHQQADSVVKLAWYSYGQRDMRDIFSRLETQEPQVRVILSRDKAGQRRRLVLEGEDFSVNLNFRVCFLDFRERIIKVCLDPYTSITVPFKGTYHFELIPERKKSQLTPG